MRRLRVKSWLEGRQQREQKHKALALSRSRWNICRGIWFREQIGIWFARQTVELTEEGGKKKKNSLKSIPAHGCFRENTLTFSQGGKKAAEGTAVRAEWQRWRRIQICGVAPRPSADVTSAGLVLFSFFKTFFWNVFFILTEASPQWGRSTVGR